MDILIFLYLTNVFLRYKKNQYIRKNPKLSVKIKNREGPGEYIFVTQYKKIIRLYHYKLLKML